MPVYISRSVRHGNGILITCQSSSRDMQPFLQLLMCKKMAAMAAFDVEDCFLNTPRGLVIPALNFWLALCFHRRRGTQYFTIGKNGKAQDHIGRPCSLQLNGNCPATPFLRWLVKTDKGSCCSKTEDCPLAGIFRLRLSNWLRCSGSTPCSGQQFSITN